MMSVLGVAVPGSASRIRAIRHGLSIVGVVVLVWFWQQHWSIPAFDTHAYWSVDPWSPYHFDGNPNQFDAFRYSPAAAQVFALAGWLPWPVFQLAFLGLLFGGLTWIGREWTLALLLFPPVLFSLWYGNIDVLMAVAVAAGFRRPAAWAFVLLTKVTPGIGLLWFFVRREWRNLAVAVGATTLFVAVSFILAPGLWFAWPQSLLAVGDAEYQPIPLSIRIAAAALLIVWGARSDRPWTVVVGAAIANPWINLRSMTILIALVPLWMARGRTVGLPSSNNPTRG